MSAGSSPTSSASRRVALAGLGEHGGEGEPQPRLARRRPSASACSISGAASATRLPREQHRRALLGGERREQAVGGDGGEPRAAVDPRLLLGPAAQQRGEEAAVAVAGALVDQPQRVVGASRARAGRRRSAAARRARASAGAIRRATDSASVVSPASIAVLTARRAMSRLAGSRSASAANSRAARAWSPTASAVRASTNSVESARVAAPGPSGKRRRAAPRRSVGLHIGIIGSSAAFGHDPVDVLGRVLDVACLAVDAVLRVDLKPR